MLAHLSINNIALFSELNLSLPSGFIAITGETGAGKSIILDAISFITGKKISNILKYESEKGWVIASFEKISDEVSKLLQSIDIDVKNHETLILKRTITSDNKTKCYVNSEPVTLSFLKKLGDVLLEIHGQQDQRFLTEASMQLELLDIYSNNQTRLKQIGILYQRYTNYVKEYEEKKLFVTQSIKEIDYLKYIINELETVAPKIGEENDLAIKRGRIISDSKLVHVIKDAANEIDKIIDNSSINHFLKTFIRLSSEYPHFNQVVEPLEKSLNEFNIASDHLSKIIANHLPQDDLNQIEERLFTLRALAKKHGTTADELANTLNNARQKLELLDNAEKEFDDLNIKISQAKTEYLKSAKQLSEIRKINAIKLQNHIVDTLKDLKMTKVKLEISIDEDDNLYCSSSGINNIVFLISTNPGVPLAKLSNIASGGELSRIMLAIKTAMTGTDKNVTMIFDEIDTGLGGIAVSAVGEKLAAIDNDQILVVTHQPQIAARAEHQLNILKKFSHDSTNVEVKWLTTLEEREREIARMISGENITVNTLTAAREFLVHKKNLT